MAKPQEFCASLLGISPEEFQKQFDESFPEMVGITPSSPREERQAAVSKVCKRLGIPSPRVP